MQIMEQQPDKTARYYDEVLRNLNELLILLTENNIMLKQLITTQREDHETNIGIHDNLRKIRFSTQ
jgi:hypothetical protein